MPNVIVPNGAKIKDLVAAIKEQLNLTPEQGAEVTNLGSITAAKKWLTDNGHQLVDEAAPVSNSDGSTTTLKLKADNQEFVYNIAPANTPDGEDAKIVGVLDNLQVVRSRQTGMRPSLQFDITMANGENESIAVHPAVALAFFASQNSQTAANDLETYQNKPGTTGEEDAAKAMEREAKAFQVPDNFVITLSGKTRGADRSAWFLPLAEAGESSPEEIAAELGISLSYIVKNETLEIKPNRTHENMPNPKVGEKYHGVKLYNKRTGFNIRSVKKSSVTAFQIARETAKAKQAEALKMESLIAAANVLKTSKADINLLGQTAAILSGNVNALLKTQESEA